MNLPFEIHEATVGDSTILSEIIRRSFRDVAVQFGLTPENCPKHPSNCDVSWIGRDMQRGVVYYRLVLDSITVGCVAMEQRELGMGSLQRLAVLPKVRRRGLGRALVKHVLAEAQRQNLNGVAIGIIAEHHELRRWYETLGFVETGRRVFPHLPFQVMFMSHTLTDHSAVDHLPGRDARDVPVNSAP